MLGPLIEQIEPVEIAVVKFLIQDYIEFRWFKHAQQLGQVVPLTPGRPRAVGDFAPFAERGSSLANPAASGIGELEPAAAEAQVPEQLLIFGLHHPGGRVVQGTHGHDDIVVVREGQQGSEVFEKHKAGVAHAQGTMDFSGATTLMGTFKTFAIYAGAVICFGGLIFAGIRMRSGRFQDAIPGLFGALFGAGVLGWGAGWIGSLTGQSIP